MCGAWVCSMYRTSVCAYKARMYGACMYGTCVERAYTMDACGLCAYAWGLRLGVRGRRRSGHDLHMISR